MGSGAGRPRIAFVFKKGREARAGGDGPTEFLFGWVQLRKAGYDAEILTDGELGLDQLPRRFWRILSHAVYRAVGVPGWPVATLLRPGNRARLAKYDVLFVSTNVFGLCFGILRRLGLIKPKVLFIAIGLIEPTTPSRLVAIYRWIFRGNVTVLTLAARDAEVLSQRLQMPVRQIPFGVDAEFWTPAAADAGTSDYVLSIGNDSHRDYPTLLAAWKPEYPLLKIITSHSIASTAANVSIAAGSWHRQILSDEQIRTLIQGARFIVLPITSTVQPSGQSVCLQAMACGKAVVITDFPGLWNRELLRDGDTCVLAGPPTDVAQLQLALERVLGDPAAAEAIGTSARAVVESHLNVDVMAAAIAAQIDALPG